jgi:hypothetical protein
VASRKALHLKSSTFSHTFISSHSHGPSCKKKRYQCSFNLLPMLCLITYRRLAQSILFFHRYLLLYHPSVLPSLHEFFYLIPRTESVPKIYSIAQCTKFPFQRVFICPNRTPDKIATSVLRRRWHLSWNFIMRNAQCFLHNSLHGSSNSLVLDVLEW